MPAAQKSAGSSVSAATTGTAPKAASGGTATMTRPANGTVTQQVGTQQAYELWKQLDQAVDQLGNELKSYGEPGVVGRDTILLRSFFDQIVGRAAQIAHACKIQWQPPQNAARR